MSSTNKNHSRNSMSRHHMNNANNRNRNICKSSSSNSSRSINSMRSTGRLALLGILFVLFATNSSLFRNTNTNNNNNKRENNQDFTLSSSSNRKLHHGHHHKHSQPPPIIDYSLYSCDEINELQSKLNLPSMDRCQFAKNCNDGDGVMFPSLFCDRSSSSTSASTSTSTSSTGTGTSKTASKTTKTTQQTTTASGSSNITPSSSSSSSSNNTTSLSAAAAAFTTTQDILSKTQNILLLIILSLTLLLLFHLLNSTTDEFFSPGLELFSLHFGLPPRFAGVTLLALGNGAPDVAATINAILEDPAKGYQMALGELTGTAMFVSGVILGVIVYMSGEEEKEEESVGDGIDGNSNVCNDDGTTNNDNEGIAKDAAIANKSNSSGGGKKKRKGVPCGSALLRDIAVLVLVLLVSMSYFERGIVDYGLVYSLLGIYVAYVLLVLGADSYHIFYHLPKLLKGEREGNNEGEGVENGCLECGDWKERDRYLEEDGAKADGTNGDSVKEFANECTPLVVSSYRSDNLQSQKQCSRHHHIYHRHQSLPVHSHTLGDSVIEAMSNYNCDEEQEIDNHQQHHHHHIMSSRRSTICGIISTIDSNGETISTNTTNKNTNILTSSSSVSGSSLTTKRIGWAPRSDDGSEPLVIFHPHHAVHPHHEGGPSFIRRQSSDSGAVGNSAEHKGILFARSWSHGDATHSDDEDVGNGILPSGSQLKQSSSCDATATPAVQSSKESNYSVQSMIITNAYTTNDENNNQEVAAISIDGDDTNNNNTPSSWKEAWKNNWQEWVDHWNDFFSDIYQNKENSLLDVILLSVELPFTIARKLTNPVPCDGYYCRPLVAVSTALSPIWLTFYFWEQFEVNIFSSNVGYIVTFTTSTIALCVARFAPDGDGPMEFYMVVPLTLYGFAIAATWLDSIADKLVQLLELFGILLRIPKTVMGLTVLAFGNSIQDLVANISISKKGLSTMAVTACLAGPIFNFGVGLGLGFLALLKTTGRDEIIVTFPSELKTGFYFTIANCFLIVIAGTVVGKGMIGREFGYIACALYVAYVITAIYV